MSSKIDLARQEKAYVRETAWLERARAVAAAYEEHNGSHTEVAEALGISKAYVTRIVAFARERGIIKQPKRGANGPMSGNERAEEFRRHQRSLGLCVNHAQRKARAGTTRCEECHEAHAESMRRSRQNQKKSSPAKKLSKKAKGTAKKRAAPKR